MLEKPDLPDALILSRLQEEYGLQATQLTFLPLGADVNTAVYRLISQDNATYFLKLRKNTFVEITVTLPLYLAAQGLPSIIAPLPTRSGQMWASLEPYQMVLYPFIEGRNAYEAALSDRQWHEFGAALKAIHAIRLPPILERQIPSDTFSPQFRRLVKVFQAQIETTTYQDATAVKFAAFTKAHRAEIDFVVARADQLAQALQQRSLPQVLCHSDIHAGNLLLTPQDGLYIVDWDAPIFAPKELDLAMVGGSATWNSTREEALFYRGYGQVDIDRIALAFYRYQRIILDIAAYCESLLLTEEGGEDREQSFQYYASMFLPGHEIELASRTEHP